MKSNEEKEMGVRVLVSCPYCKVNMCSLVNSVLGLGPFDDDDHTWVSIYSMGR